MTRRVLLFGGIMFLILFAAARPQSAGAVIGSIGGGIAEIANGLGEFFRSIAW